MPPRAVPSSLVITRPVTPAILPNTSTCDSAFWPTVASSTSSTACGAAGVELLHHADHLFQLAHQLGAVLQPAGGVDDQHVGAVGLRRAQRLEGEARRVGARLARDHLGAGALAPDFQLVDGGGAERVAGREHHLAALGRQASRRACRSVVVLPEPLTPTTRMTNGLAPPITSGFATGSRIFATSAATTAFTSSGVMPWL